MTLWTVGHSTRSLEELLSLLGAYRIEALADVRRFPGSRRLPHFGAGALEAALAERAIAYRWIPALGGRRRPAPDSPNVAWRQAGFRGYADHLASEEFAAGLAELQAMAQGLRTAMMCAEALWWQCHRRLISDVLVSLGEEVIHIRNERDAEPHRIAAPARLEDGKLTYAAAP